MVSGLTQAAPTPLEDLIRIAVENSPTLRQARLKKEAAVLKEANAHSALLPSLDVSVGVGLINQSPAGGADPWQSSLGMTLTENLYDNGTSLTRIESAKLQEALSELDWQRARDQLTLDVIQTFNQLSLQTLLLAVSNEQFETLKKQFEIVSTQYRQGLKTRKDFLRLNSQMQRTKMDVLSAETSVTKARNDLARILAIPLSAEIQPIPAAKPAQFAGPTPPLEKTFEARMAVLQNQINDLEVKLEQRKNRPQLNLTAGLNYSNTNYLGSAQSFTATQGVNGNLLLGLNYNILDWGVRSRNVAVARASADLEAARQQDTLLSLQSSILSLMKYVAQMRLSAKTSQELLALETETYTVIRRDYADGAVSYLDLVTSLNNLLSARVQALTTAFTLSDLEAKTLYYGGNLYETTSH